MLVNRDGKAGEQRHAPGPEVDLAERPAQQGDERSERREPGGRRGRLSARRLVARQQRDGDRVKPDRRGVGERQTHGALTARGAHGFKREEAEQGNVR